MKNSNSRRRLLASTMFVGAALAAVAPGALAQTTTPIPDASQGTGGAVQEVVVTGSRLRSPNATSASPVTSINSQEMKLEGITNVEDLINNLPQAFGDYGGFESNGATGTATLDLRGIGAVRTLVLVDGKRLPAGDPTYTPPDINFIPPALIDRVDVLTGGASAVYGSDAVAGVVNFIMKKNFEGLQIDAETTIAQHDNNNKQVRTANTFGATSFGFPNLTLPHGTSWDGQRHTVTITGGSNTPDGKGNVEFYGGYSSIDAVNEGQRDWSDCSLATNNSNTTQQYCGGSSTDATGRLQVESGPNKSSKNTYNITGTPTTTNGVSILPAFNNGQLYNYAPLNYIQRPDVRYTAGEYSTYEINKALNVYTSFMFMDDHSVADIGPSGSFYGTLYNISCADPLLSAAQVNTICGSNPAAGQTQSITIGRRNVEGGPRVTDIEHTDYRFVIGARGDLGDGWNYDTSIQYGRVVNTDIESGFLLNSHLQNALDVVSVNGVATCRSIATNPTCVPYNIWKSGGVTAAALSYLSGTSVSAGSTTQQVATASIQGDLSHYGVKSPWADSGVGISLGSEYRREALEVTYDSTAQSGDLAGNNGASLNTAGSQSDYDLFGELNIPVVQNLPFVKDLEVDTGYRFSDYTSGGGNSTYKYDIKWQTTSDLLFRASYDRASRAPNVQDLFNPATSTLFSGTDPCAGSSPKYTAAQCYNTLKNTAPGLTLAQFTSTVYGQIPQCVSGQCGGYTGGNPNLVPEIADTLSYGFVLTPKFLPRFLFSADYFDINVHKAITTIPGGTTLAACALQNNQTACALINRNADFGYAIYGGTGNNVGYVDLAKVNAGSIKETGVDVVSSYNFRLSDVHLPDLGRISFNFTGTYVNKFETYFPGDTYDCAGLYGPTCGTPTPHWRAQTRFTWETPWTVSVSLNWRYISATKLDFNTDQPGLQNGYYDTKATDARIPDFNYFDLSVLWHLKDRFTMRAGVNNIFDKTPPLLDSNSFGVSAPPFGNGNTYPQVYDPLGRVIFVGLTADF